MEENCFEIGLGMQLMEPPSGKVFVLRIQEKKECIKCGKEFYSFGKDVVCSECSYKELIIKFRETNE